MHPYGYIANPNSPLEARYRRGYQMHAPMAHAYGESSGFTSFLGSVGSQSVIDLLDDPRMQTKLVEISDDCQERAKEGVTEWGKENWGYIFAGVGALIGINYLMLISIVVPALRRKG
tara:strand:- start:81 stop:431 length:351 start_codon:yes stop_codon:yes gene_type:complete